MSKKIIFIFLVFVNLLSLDLSAQELTASVNKNRVGVGEQFILTFSLNTNGSGFRAPSLNDFNVYSGPNQSTNMSFINGSMSQQISFTYYLAAKSEGKFTIGAASINSGGKTYTSKPIVIEVAKGNAPHSNNGQNQKGNSNQQNNSDEYDLGNNLFIRTVTSKSRAYVGEQIIVSYKVYTRINILDNAATKLPVFNGFWSEEILSGNRQAEFKQENIDGLQYQVAEIKKAILIPQHSGSLSVDPLVMDVVTRIKNKNRSNDPFEQFFNMGGFGSYKDVKVSISSKPIKIDVLPLPEKNKPESFKGAVGDFSMEVNIKPSNLKLKSNDAGNLIVTISGKGNLKLLEPLKIKAPSDIEMYDAKSTDKISTTSSGLSGKRSFDYLFIPRNPGKYTLESAPFTYFDPEKGNYVTLKTPDFNLDVERGTSSNNSANPIISSYNTNKEDVKLLGNDIRYIKTKTNLTGISEPFYGSIFFWILLLGPFIGFASFVTVQSIKNRNGGTTEYQQKMAIKKAQNQLKLASVHLSQNNHELFYKEILNALDGFLSAKLLIPISELNKEKISEALQKRGANAELIYNLKNIVEKCEFAKYAQVKDNNSMQTDYTQAINIISTIEQNIV
ncbi:MAG: BatD family protein [Bacteroidota bacterium]|jgi:hypothetical protein